jgi:hypothetical protein
VVKSTVTITRIEYRDKIVNRNTVVDREIIKYKDGTEKIVEKIINRDVVKEKEVTKDREVEVVKYEKTAWLYLNVGYGLTINPNILAPTKEVIINAENVSVGLTVNLKPYLISLDYQHVHANPDAVGIKVSIPVF